MKDTIIGLDLAKTIFHLVQIDRTGKMGRKRKLRRGQLKSYLAQCPESLVAMEACSSAHYWARVFQTMGHDVMLLPPQHVKGYLRGQKNDFNDALAIAEGALHGAIRPVAIKTIEQQDSQAFHRVRSQLIAERVRLSNQIRGLLSEYGIVFGVGEATFRKAIPQVLEDANNTLTPRFRDLLNKQYDRYLLLEQELAWYQQQLEQEAKQDDVCQRLIEIPGFGAVVSSAVKNWMGDGKQFQRGREASAALGLVPRQYSSGGKERLYGITKKGSAYVRSLVVHGARSVVFHASKKDDALSRWINHLVDKRGFNKAAVALANKLIRIAWVVIARQERYKPQTQSLLMPA